MMKSTVLLLGALALAGAAGCTGLHKAQLEIRPLSPRQGGVQSAGIAAGHALFQRGEYALAMDAYRQVLRHDPGDADAYNGLAISYAAMGRYDIADRFFQLALSFAPADTKVRRNFARCLEQQGRHDESRALLASLAAPGTLPATPRTTLAQIAARPVAAARSNGAPAPAFLVRQSLTEVRLDTLALDQGENLGRFTPQITVTILNRGAEKDAAAEQADIAAPADQPPHVAANHLRGGNAAPFLTPVLHQRRQVPDAKEQS
ncbi:tetratricopeptide repeat protein [Sphingobium sp. H39-3-25]|uniref:tetratricopeptide repeat protein n=1 Tax=Sphingobium arseniciresistens TaxID=3030834 RepID=UPI0023BA0FB1|nr:tetratricopeptide repeat protein [Sphingobium arseniciresistens]